MKSDVCRESVAARLWTHALAFEWSTIGWSLVAPTLYINLVECSGTAVSVGHFHCGSNGGDRPLSFLLQLTDACSELVLPLPPFGRWFDTTHAMALRVSSVLKSSAHFGHFIFLLSLAQTLLWVDPTTRSSTLRRTRMRLKHCIHRSGGRWAICSWSHLACQQRASV